MGTSAEFEEKEFETLANASFALGGQSRQQSLPSMFSPGQVLEKTLGFDFSVYLSPSSTTYKLLFGSFTGPVTPGAQAAAVNLPPIARNVNTFLQYKRPTQFSRNHRQRLWRDQEFLRFDARSHYQLNGQRHRNHAQLEALDAIASQNPSVVVRYACPSTAIRRALYSQYAQGTLLASCCFLDPRKLSHAPTGTHEWWHDFWTFLPGNPGSGYPNPEGPYTVAETGDQFWHEVNGKLNSKAPQSPLREIETIRSSPLLKTRDSEFFKSPSESRGPSKSLVIQQAVDSTQRDFLNSPRNSFSNYHWAPIKNPNPSRRPNTGEMESIRAAVELAATAKEMGLTWIVAQN